MTYSKESLKIVFFGTPDFAVESLSRLVEGGYNIVGVVTMPDKEAGRGHKLLQSPVKQYALEHGLRLLQPERLKNPQFVEELRSLGTFNLHASLLPKYRGAAPINWAVINGETETGVTTFFLKHEIDTGDIIQQRKIDIADNDNVGIVHDRLMTMGADMVIETVDAIITGTVKPIPQDQLCNAGTEPTSAPKIFKETCHICWNRPARDVRNLVRGLSPYPAAWTEITDAAGTTHTAKVFEVSLATDAETTGHRPGDMWNDGTGRLLAMCNDTAVEITQLQLAGKRRMSAADFLRGFHLKA